MSAVGSVNSQVAILNLNDITVFDKTRERCVSVTQDAFAKIAIFNRLVLFSLGDSAGTVQFCKETGTDQIDVTDGPDEGQITILEKNTTKDRSWIVDTRLYVFRITNIFKVTLNLNTHELQSAPVQCKEFLFLAQQLEPLSKKHPQLDMLIEKGRVSYFLGNRVPMLDLTEQKLASIVYESELKQNFVALDGKRVCMPNAWPVQPSHVYSIFAQTPFWSPQYVTVEDYGAGKVKIGICDSSGDVKMAYVELSQPLDIKYPEGHPKGTEQIYLSHNHAI